ncbi:hypothetical protein [uncultured Sphingomonas sp.]|uniref:hypothetical protein n=1 Tax=uncultured Sphingomonas sp. TaxID=158754 RepID=UPI0025F0B76E|nr:hypothetical protein [uncultured Sphingomonas sp.]
MSKALTIKKTSSEAVALPDVVPLSAPLLTAVTEALGLSRDIVADDEQIEHAWTQLPRLLRRIPPQLRDERIARMCIAVASGLFDAAINYVWNASVVELRDKVRRFGIAVVPQVLDDKDFDEDSLLDLKDAELLDLCRKLNLIGDDDFFFLDQCRATRNSFSVAHPAAGTVDEDEFLTFLSRCQKHALTSERNPRGVDTKGFLVALKGSGFKKEQREEWQRRIRETYDAQRELLFVMLHGLYCDPNAEETARQNALQICQALSDEFSPKVNAALVDRHQEYKAKGDDARLKASMQFFEKIGKLGLLGDADVHSVFTAASRKLLSVHNAWDNFHNEPPFADRLEQLARKNRVPASAQPTFVEAVVTCGTGNAYGVSRAAEPDYHRMVKAFSPAEIAIMLALPKGTTAVAGRIKTTKACEKRFRALVGLLDPKSVPTSAKAALQKWKP